MTGVLTEKKKKFVHRHTERGEHGVKTEAETRMT